MNRVILSCVFFICTQQSYAQRCDDEAWVKKITYDSKTNSVSIIIHHECNYETNQISWILTSSDRYGSQKSTTIVSQGITESKNAPFDDTLKLYAVLPVGEMVCATIFTRATDGDSAYDNDSLCIFNQ